MEGLAVLVLCDVKPSFFFASMNRNEMAMAFSDQWNTVRKEREL